VKTVRRYQQEYTSAVDMTAMEDEKVETVDATRGPTDGHHSEGSKFVQVRKESALEPFW
jgi:hypothetical protein